MEMLARAQVEALLRRCERRRRLWQLTRLSEAWGRAAWPGLCAVLIALVIARASGWPLGWLAPAVLVALIAALGWTLRRRDALRVPGWWLPARVDRAAGARGALMACFERAGDARGDQPVPLSALRVKLGPAWPWRLSFAGLGFVLAYALCLAVPIETARAREVRPLTPLPVERAQRWLAKVEPKDATAKLFVDSSRKTLQRLAAKTSGLDRADFDALERIEERARGLLDKQAAARATKQEALDAMRELDALLASYEAKTGQNGSAGALREALERRRDLLERGGLGKQQLEQMLEQARSASAAEQERGKDGQGSGAPSPGFDPDAAKELREQLAQQMQELQTSEGGQEQLQPGKGGVDEGPGFAPLALNEESRVDDARFEASTFKTSPDDRTVLLGTGLSRRADERRVDPQGQSSRAFEAGTDTELWPKHVEPRHRAVLERYFASPQE
jgi:hypothetical protein